jgi:glycine/D-amino acid oxidase-like deaminating enzyme/nitrite reductase/ring-hydroxylating ferredoxin subunit
VVGAGIVGLTTALLLAQHGRSVVVVEAGAVAAGVSGFTTAKVTAGHGLIYSQLESKFEAAAACLYAAAQNAGLELIRRLCAAHSIDCDLESQANYVVASSPNDVAAVQEEAAAARRAGLDASPVTAALSLTPGTAVRIPDQAQFHVRKYLLALADLVISLGGQIAENSRVTEVAGDGPFVVRTKSGSVRADVAVVATHYPIVEQGFFATRIHPRRSYVVAAPLTGPTFDGMYISASGPARSVRTAVLADGRRLVLVGGEGHRVGQEADTPGRYAALEHDMRHHFTVGETMYRWSTQDNFSVDGLPYIGAVPEHDGLYVATGFAGWGMTNGSMAGLTIANAITGSDNDWAPLFELDRRHIRASAKSFIAENTNVAAQQVADVLQTRPGAPTTIQPGHGAVVSVDGQDVALSRSLDGRLHAVSAKCTHMGCTVNWNAAESSWDCPCHGSRFAPDGQVLHGPATGPLAPATVDRARQSAEES